MKNLKTLFLLTALANSKSLTVSLLKTKNRGTSISPKLILKMESMETTYSTNYKCSMIASEIYMLSSLGGEELAKMV